MNKYAIAIAALGAFAASCSPGKDAAYTFAGG